MKPGFEFIFALSLMVIIVLPLLVFAQSTKDMEIKITGGDTTINGKNIQDLSPAGRKQALKDLDNLGSAAGTDNAGRQHLVIRNRRPLDGPEPGNIITGKRVLQSDDHDPARADEPRFSDTAEHEFKFRMKRLHDKDSAFTFNYRLNTDRQERPDRGDRHFNFRMRGPGEENFRHKNIQRFDYTNTGSDGISTHASFSVTDPSPEKLKALAGSEKAELDIKDLNLVPEFSAGKVLLIFGLPSKSVAEVKFTGNDGKLIWSDKAMNGSFNKSFALGLNGVYFLQVKQGDKVALKRILKEE
ncbi:MAG: type sorting protein [Mucilaginibacter sp.]|nr:type sorting protein [Mucilaginibacter sp.]